MAECKSKGLLQSPAASIHIRAIEPQCALYLEQSQVTYKTTLCFPLYPVSSRACKPVTSGFQ
eukprot:6477531-Amphidinium_carterae.1